jgi:hypothetical protein
MGSRSTPIETEPRLAVESGPTRAILKEAARRNASAHAACGT